MTPLAILFLLINALALLRLPRRWAPLPLLVGACYMTLGQGVVIGPFNFHVVRLLISVGFLRLILRGEWPGGKLTSLDHVMLAWGGWSLCSSAFHGMPTEALVYRLGVVYNALGIYFLVRSLCQNENDVVFLAKITAIMLVPLALEMVQEQLTGKNLFSIFGRVQESVTVRNGRLRAQGPFAHSILAGTVAAACLPLALGIWRRHPFAAKIGLGACSAMVIASASSGPLMSTIFSLLALALWRWRHLTVYVRIAAVMAYIALDCIMTRPAYFIIQKLDLTGSSTGWHRAELIRSAIEHLNEWWLAGTDRTRHWMPTGVSWSPDHTDITNHYILNGVHGGLPLMILFGAAIWIGFRYVGTLARGATDEDGRHRWVAWTLGSSLFAHAASCVSIAYFDQSFVFLYSTLAAISSTYAGVLTAGANSSPGTESETNVYELQSRVCSTADAGSEYGLMFTSR